MSWVASAISYAFVAFVVVILAIVVLLIIAAFFVGTAELGRYRRVIAIMGFLAFAVFVAWWFLPGTSKLGGFEIAIPLLSLMIAMFALASVAEKSWRPSQWLAYGAGMLIAAGAIIYIAFPGFASLVDTFLPPSARVILLVAGYFAVLLAPKLIGEFLQSLALEPKDFSTQVDGPRTTYSVWLFLPFLLFP
jgi:hypothetical protein